MNTLVAPDAHRNFSKALAKFAQKAREIIKGYSDYCIYAGGDDVLALLPLETVIECANALNKAFRQHLQGFQLPDDSGTLSIGVAICHRMEPPSIALEAARSAERAAKQLRNALAVAVHPRSGSSVMVKDPWRDTLLQDWQNSKKALRHGIARGFPYELQHLARQWEGAISHPNFSPRQKRELPKRLKKEALRILERKKETGQNTKAIMEEVIDSIQSVDQLKTQADRLAIAHFLTRG
ncbi:type III-B CRISPR-associated protein Cas10/Cmr2 [Chthonomonas calidirosea]|uniref:type III-B CRISPR-associated protein Cas10/Cmr2 n=1 Tax=Chthonomonas calidirosea TaxID=454171 RepID=UPI001E5111F2|nr:type III-B CRISPR-associated protein Cas10/Cmr2 [Chthonomonas calidirosea]